jgi:hypothetical protein
MPNDELATEQQRLQPERGRIVVQTVQDMKDEEGFNAQTETYENVVQAGVIEEHLFNSHAGKPRPRRAGNLTGDRPIGS